MTTYRRPGVYLEESLLSGPNEAGSAAAVGMFVGAAARGPATEAVRCDSWSEYVSRFGGWEVPPGADVAYLPYAVYSYFQNGGRVAYISRALSETSGEASAYTVVGLDADDEAANAFDVVANSPGVWGDDLSVAIEWQQTAGDQGSLVYTLVVYRLDSIGNRREVERFTDLSVLGDVPGTKRVDFAVNDQVYGSRFITVSALDTDVAPGEDNTPTSAALVGGSDGNIPNSSDLLDAAVRGVESVEGPIMLNVVPHTTSGGSLVQTCPEPSSFTDRSDIFVINDAAPARTAGTTGADYAASLENTALFSAGNGSSFVASYTPWIVIPDPPKQGGTIVVPPGGSVAGVYARTDITEGIFRAPAGISVGAISNAVNVDTKFSTSLQGDLNAKNINVIRPSAGSPIAIMGARTRKKFGVDRYVSARRTLIYVKESLRVSSEFAVFENNDERLWTRLRSTADNILRPIWSAGGLRGESADQAYYIVCDDTINTPQVISSGEVRMEVGVALEYPAEFIVIKVAQFNGGGSDIEIQV